MLKKIYNLAFLLALVAGLTACGGNKPATEEPTEPATEEPTTPVTEEPATPAAEELVAETEIMLAATGDDMSAISFEPKEFTLTPYTAVKVNFVNQSSAAGMNHNAVFIPFDQAVADEIRAAGLTAGGPAFSPSDSRIMAQTKMLNPGETDAITFETPGPGKYYVICTYPGHKAMVAVMTIAE
ncbi:MAG: hypothetical protein HYZ16_06505 [Bacteroidetes bacterium]|jgi:azurin|nr:hypothetical protein [Bacteroidota bacterium]